MNGEKSVLNCKTCGESGFNWQHGEFSGVACRSGPHVEVLKTPTRFRLKIWAEENPNFSFAMLLLLALGLVCLSLAAIASVCATMTCDVSRSRGLHDTPTVDDNCWRLDVRGKTVGCFYDDGGLDAAEVRFGCVDALRLTK